MSRPLCVNDCKILPVSKEMKVLDAFGCFILKCMLESVLSNEI